MIPLALLPDVRAHVEERLVFNFRIPAEVLEQQLPPWLDPQSIRGSAVASFCILDLRRLDARRIPFLGVGSGLNAAWRFGAFRGGEPVVYVLERLTSSRLGSAVTRLGCPGHHPHATFEAGNDAGLRRITVSRGGVPVFSATFEKDRASGSRLFASEEEFREFLRAGKMSYAPSARRGAFTRVSLDKIEGRYEPLRVVSVTAPLLEEWTGKTAADLLDGGFSTRNGRYIWRLHGVERGDSARDLLLDRLAESVHVGE
jgi:hypothetical protein